MAKLKPAKNYIEIPKVADFDYVRSCFSCRFQTGLNGNIWNKTTHFRCLKYDLEDKYIYGEMSTDDAQTHVCKDHRWSKMGRISRKKREAKFGLYNNEEAPNDR